MARILDYRNKKDMQELAVAVLALPPKQFKLIAPAVLAGDLMRTHWWIRFTIWVMMKRRRIGKVEAYRQMHRDMLNAHNVDMFENLQLATALHIRDGRDAYDKKSAGGFNANEVELMCELITVALNNPG
jgi:hypothetical protein